MTNLQLPARLGIPLKLLGLQLWEACKTAGASSNDGHYNAAPDAPQLTCEICTQQILLYLIHTDWCLDNH